MAVTGGVDSGVKDQLMKDFDTEAEELAGSNGKLIQISFFHSKCGYKL